MAEHDQKRSADDTGAISFGLSGKGLSLQVEARVGANPGLKVSLGTKDTESKASPAAKQADAARPSKPGPTPESPAPKASMPSALQQPSSPAPGPAAAAPLSAAAAEATKGQSLAGDGLSKLQKALREAFMSNAGEQEIDCLRFSLFGMGVVEGHPSREQTRALLMLLPDPLFFSGLASGFAHPVVRDVLSKFIADNFETVSKATHTA